MTDILVFYTNSRYLGAQNIWFKYLTTIIGLTYRPASFSRYEFLQCTVDNDPSNDDPGVFILNMSLEDESELKAIKSRTIAVPPVTIATIQVRIIKQKLLRRTFLRDGYAFSFITSIGSFKGRTEFGLFKLLLIRLNIFWRLLIIFVSTFIFCWAGPVSFIFLGSIMYVEYGNRFEIFCIRSKMISEEKLNFSNGTYGLYL